MTEQNNQHEEDIAATEGGIEEPIATSISQVGRKPVKPLSTPVKIIGGLAVLIVVLAILFSDDEKKAVINSTNEEYELRQSKAPKPVDKPIPKASEQDKQLEIPDMVEPVLSAADQQKIQMENDLRQRRRHAPVILINNDPNATNNKSQKAGSANAEDAALGDTGAADIAATRKMELLAQTTKAALEAQTGANAANQTEKPIAASELKSAQVVTNYAANLLDPGFKITQGKVIPGTLETAIQTDLSGMIRAKVSEDVYSEDGSQILVMKGSRLIGEYKSGIAQGQVRVFAIWTRLRRPDGIYITLDSPGTDSIGRSGMEGWVDTHFVERFGASAMMSVISGFAQHGSNNQSQQMALSNSFSKATEVILNKSINIPPTIGVNQGDKINVFVAKDLDFKRAILSPEHELSKL